LPEFTIYSIFLIKLNGFLLVFLFIFRALREDHRFFTSITVDPYFLNIGRFSFSIGKHISILYRKRHRIHNVYLEHILYTIIVYIFITNTLDIRDFFIYNNNTEQSIILSIEKSHYKKFFIFLFFIIRQSTYAYFV